MKINIEEKRETTKKGILLNNNVIKVQDVAITYKNNRLRCITIDGEFDKQTVEKTIANLPDNDWIRLILNKKIPMSYFTFLGDHKIIHEKIKELIQKLNIVTYLSIYENGITGTVKIENVSHRQQSVPERIILNYAYNTIEKVELSYISTNETKQALMEVLNIPSLDKLSPHILTLSLSGEITKSLNQQLVEFINTLNQSFYLSCKNETCMYQPVTLDKFLYFNDKIYPLVIQMKETYPKIAKFLREEIRRVLNKFSGFDTAIYFEASTKQEYKKVLSKALTVLSKLNSPLPEYLVFGLKRFLTRRIVIHGLYEKLDSNLDFLFTPEGRILLPLNITVYDNKHKLILINKSDHTPEMEKNLLVALKKFLGTEPISENLGDPFQFQNPENNKILYYLLKYGNYYIVTNKELLPTATHNISQFIE